MEQKQRALEYMGSCAVGDECRVVVRRGDAVYDLPTRLDLRNHSPTGFAWGYGGSGPAQLALALLADFLGADKEVGDIIAQVLYQDLKWHAIAPIPMDHAWKWSGAEFAAVLAEMFKANPERLDCQVTDALRREAFEVVCRMNEPEADDEAFDWDRAEEDCYTALAKRAALLLEGIT